ncbi:MAG: arylsulfatase [Bacteroidaceae bacterium]|nr:arylsulfatase [Bacteroidaceae bacterium]
MKNVRTNRWRPRLHWSLLTVAWPLATAAQERPNVVFILCDDMGWGDLACYGQQYIATPHIDRLASEGMQFMQAYSGSPVSAPSRASLMTGQHTGHCAVRGNKEYWSQQDTVHYGQCIDFARVGQHPLDPARLVLHELMKAHGYRTAQFGKWAGGYEGSASTPDKRGVDEYYGPLCQFQAHSYYPNFLNEYSRERGDTAVRRQLLPENYAHAFEGPDYYERPIYSADTIHRRALQWLERQQPDQPFFALLTYTLPHAELVQPDDSLVATYRRQFRDDHTFAGQNASWYHAIEHTHAQFAAMITRLDCYVGEIVSLLERRGLTDNTIVVFTSDNGPHEEGGADPTFFGRDGQLRGIKRSCHEGGIRVPFIVRWPGHVPQGRRNPHPIAFWDVMPTLCDILGTNVPSDGISFLPTLTDRPAEQHPHDFLYWEFCETNQIAVRQANWKLIVKAGRPELYDLAQDIHEDHDLSALYPQKVRELVALIHREHTPNEHFRVTLPKLDAD